MNTKKHKRSLKTKIKKQERKTQKTQRNNKKHRQIQTPANQRQYRHLRLGVKNQYSKQDKELDNHSKQNSTKHWLK